MAIDRILIVDDDQTARSALRAILEKGGYDVSEAQDGDEALARMRERDPQIVLAEVRLARMDGLTLLKKAREQGSKAVFLMLSPARSVDTVVEAMRAGAENYLVKPLEPASVLVFVEKALEKGRLIGDVQNLRERVRERFRFERMVGGGPELQAIFEMVKRAAPSKATVLIRGESGTGKELIAQALHEASPRHDKPFVKVSCAALSETLLESELFGHERGLFTEDSRRRAGRLELADGGTLLLDEIGELTQGTQVKLLRLLEEGKFERVGGTETIQVDVRVIAASNHDLAAEVEAGRFREDLYYRLNVIAVTLPPLRQRKCDIPSLAAHFIEKYGKAYDKQVHDLAPGMLQALIEHDWPGNVRELENAIERAVVLCKGSELTADELPATLRGSGPAVRESSSLIPGASLHEIEHEAILRTMTLAGGSTTRAAAILGISVRKIQYRLKEYGSTAPQPVKAEHAPPPQDPIPDDQAVFPGQSAPIRAARIAARPL